MGDRKLDEHRTELDGWLAEWRIDCHCIRIMLVRNGSEKPLVSFTVASAPDLVQMREQFPELSRLWDAVRHEYWAEFALSPKHSRGRVRSLNDARSLRLVSSEQPSDPMTARINELTARAKQAGYRLVRDGEPPCEWELLDIEDGARLYSTVDLDQVEQWLNE